MDSFSKNFKTLRKRMGLTQKELADKLGVKKTTVSNYETGFSSPPKDGLVMIADFFNVSLDELLYSSENSPKNLNSVVMNSPEPDNSAFSRSVKIFSTITSLSDIISVKNLIDTISLPKELPHGEYFGIATPDNSLKARGIFKDDYIIFKARELVKGGDLVAISVNSEPAICGIFHETESEIGFLPLDFSESASPKFFSKKHNSIVVLGKAVRAFIKIK